MSYVKNHWFIVYLLVSLVFLLIINDWFWPTPDEYYYAVISKNIANSLVGKFCLSCFNTEHTFLVSAVVGIINLFRGNYLDINELRVPVILFSLGTLVVLRKISILLFDNEGDRFWFLVLLALIPGFYLFSVRLMLDIPLLFGYCLISYMLLSRKSVVLASISLLMILLIKEYGFFLSLAFIIPFRIIDNIKFKYSFKRIIIDLVGLIGPSIILIYFLLFTSILPYPRLLETQMIEYSAGMYGLVSSIAKGNKITADMAFKIVAEKIQYSLENIESSSIETNYANTVINRLWLIYKYNFSSQDISVILLPMFLAGFVGSLINLIKNLKNYKKSRSDIYFLLYSLVFFYLNWHEALNVHGFRLTIPLLLPILYYSTICLRRLLTSKKNYKLFYGLLLVGSTFLYLLYIKSLGSYRSVISREPLFSFLLMNKFYIFLILFLLIFLLLTINGDKILFLNKKLVITTSFVFLLLVAMIPSYLDYKVSARFFGYDYGMQSAHSWLNETAKSGAMIGANIHTYEMNYYSGNTFLNTIGSKPLNRNVTMKADDFIRYSEDKEVTDDTFMSKVKYFFYLNKEMSVEPNSLLFESLKSRYCSTNTATFNNRKQWYIFDLNRKAIDGCADST